MLTTNIDVSDALVNVARGEVVHIVTTDDCKVTHILVKFDHPNVGIKAKQASHFHQMHPTAVPLKKHEAVFLAKGKRGSEITRLQFPLTLAWSTSIHKVQGLTLDRIVVDMKGTRFNPWTSIIISTGVLIVGLSRKMRKQGVRISPPVQDGQELSLYICLYSHS